MRMHPVISPLKENMLCYVMLFLKMKCKQHCLNPTVPPLKPNTHGLRPRIHSYELPECRLQIRKNSCSVYIDMMMVRYCIVLCLFFCVIMLIVLVNLCIYVCYMF